MTGRPLDLTQRQVRALCKGAKAAGCIPVVTFGNTVVRLVPEDRAIPESGAARVDEAANQPSAYDKWKAGRNAREP